MEIHDFTCPKFQNLNNYKMTTCILKKHLYMLNLKRSHDKKYTQDLLLGRAFSYTGRAIKEQSWTLNVNTNGPPRAQTQERDKDLFSAGVNISLQHSFFFHYSTYHNLVYCSDLLFSQSSNDTHISRIITDERSVCPCSARQQCASFLHCVLLRRGKM